MRIFVWVVAAWILLFQSSAFAETTETLIASPTAVASNPGKPQLRADLVEITDRGAFVAPTVTYTLTLNEDASEHPVSFTMMQTVKNNCPPGAACLQGTAARTWELKIKAQWKDLCGGSKYLAMAWQENKGRPKNLSYLWLTDNRTRTCDENFKYEWEVRFKSYDRPGYQIFGGTPHPVDTAVSCDDIGKDMFCSALYLPSQCSARSVDGTLLPNPIEATGSNACFAKGALKREVCRQGFRADDLRDEEITCKTNHD
jgi:hypothetical protein